MILANVKYILFGLLGLILLMLILFIIIYFIKKNRLDKMYSRTKSALEEYVKDKEGNVIKSTYKEFDFMLEEKSTITLFKIIPNFSSYEILINSKIKWQIKKSPDDESLLMVDDVETVMNFNMENTTKKINKVFLIYPSSRLLMMATNECEYMFVYPQTNVYDTKVINFNEFEYLIKTKNIDL